MSKPISFGFGKQKPSGPAQSTGFAARKQTVTKAPSLKALHNDSDNEDEEGPRHESVTGFTASGAILSQPVQDSKELVIKNTGNGDWRRRGRKNLLPSEVQAQRQGQNVVMVERDEVSKASGLQFVEPSDEPEAADTNGEQQTVVDRSEPDQPVKRLTADEEALQALLDDGTGKPKSTAVIEQQGNARLTVRDEIEDFRDDVASRPESSTLEDYAAMPVEEFGLAMLRGMGQKRRAKGEAIDLNTQKDGPPRKIRKQEGFLGIGAKPVAGADIELGAWGKADMRKNNRGQGFFTPVMLKNNKTGELISEEEMQKRLKESKGQKGEEDWRKRRDRNLEHSGRDRERKALTNGEDGYRDQMNSFSRSGSSKPDRDDREHHRSKRDGDRDTSRPESRREDDRSKDRRRRDDIDRDSRHRDKHRERHRDDDKYDSSSSHRGHRDGDRDRDRDRRRDKDKDRSSDDRRHRDRR